MHTTEIPATERRPMRWWQRMAERFAMSKPGTWLILHVNRHVDPILARLTGGRWCLTNLIGAPLALLTSTGARSGLQRTTPLLYVQDGERIILVASYGGNTRNPAWYYNLKAHPEAQLCIHGVTCSYTAREAQGEERERLWERAVAFYAGFAKYAERTEGRKIPVWVLTPKAKESKKGAMQG